jgi:glycosyltransferase involved in cell wall biosynthesis
MSKNSKCDVVIPMYNAGKTIVETLRGLEKQTYKDFQVILVDDGSTDDTRNVVEKFKEKSNLDIVLICQQNSGPAVARNLGAKKATGDIILFTDSDCIPPRNWVAEMIEPIGKDIVGVHCGYKVKNPEFLVARYIDFEIRRRHSKIYNKITDSVGTYSFSIKKEVFDEMGGFNTSYSMASGEDFEFSYKLSENGYKIFFTDKTYVYHYHPDSLWKYLKQQFYRGYWRVPLYLKNKARIKKKDSYTGYEAQVQFILVGVFFLSFLFMVFLYYVPVIVFLVLLFSNMGYGVFSARSEKKMIIVAPFLASLRSICGFLGAICYSLIGRAVR